MSLFAAVQILRCCLCEDSRDPTVLLVVIPVVAQIQIPILQALFPGSGMYKAGIACVNVPRACSLPWSAGP